MGTKRSETFLLRRKFSAAKVPNWLTRERWRPDAQMCALTRGRSPESVTRGPGSAGRGAQPLRVPRPTARAGGAPWRLSVGSRLLSGRGAAAAGGVTGCRARR